MENRIDYAIGSIQHMQYVYVCVFIENHENFIHTF